MKVILDNYKNLSLCKEGNFYYIIGLNYINLVGTKNEVLKELKRWKKEIDNNNEYMLNIENHFIKILENDL